MTAMSIPGCALPAPGTGSARSRLSPSLSVGIRFRHEMSSQELLHDAALALSMNLINSARRRNRPGISAFPQPLARYSTSRVRANDTRFNACSRSGENPCAPSDGIDAKLFVSRSVTTLETVAILGDYRRRSM